MNRAEEIYTKVRNGDPLSDEDLRYGIFHFDQLENLASAAGPVFHLASKEAGRVRGMLEDFQRSRRRR